LPDQYFGEGITLWNDTLVQLTYQSRIGFVYDRESFEVRRTFGYQTEGWGITHDGTHLIMSDGTSTLYFRDPESFATVRRLEVTDQGAPIQYLNELEYVQGTIYANVWPTDRIAMISPETGQVVGWLDLTGLLSAEDQTQPGNLLNGIAYDAARDRLFVTGKCWPKLFELDLKK
jgi:glutamine cyclotransferase